MILPRGMAHHFSTVVTCLYILGAHGGILTSDFFVQDRGPKETAALLSPAISLHREYKAVPEHQLTLTESSA